jgi:hypothetical protein
VRERTPPDVVERMFDVAEHLDDGPEQDDDADTGDHAAFGVVQHILGEPDDLLNNLLLGGKLIQELLL